MKNLTHIPNTKLTLDWQFAFQAPASKVSIDITEWQTVGKQAEIMVKELNSGAGNNEDKGVKMVGWQTFAKEISEDELRKIKDVAVSLQKKCEVIWIIGIGGSYLGARAMIEAMYGKDYNEALTKKGLPKIYFLGTDVDPVWLETCVHNVEPSKLGVIVISKSGTTLEAALALRVALSVLEKSKNWQERIVAITDKEKGALKELATKQGWSTFVVPDNVGGRFSVMTPVGLVPMAVAGIDPHKYLTGVSKIQTSADSENFSTNPAIQLAAWRFAQWQKDATVEYVTTNSQAFTANLDWLVQLEAESEGQEGHGVHVVPAMFSRDLHSFGQLIQDGPRNLFEVAVKIKSQTTLTVPSNDIIGAGDGLQSLEGVKIEEINNGVIDGALSAHFTGGVPSIIITVNGLDEEALGSYHYLMMKATAISGYLMDHNPFIQPGVQGWKKGLQDILDKLKNDS